MDSLNFFNQTFNSTHHSKPPALAISIPNWTLWSTRGVHYETPLMDPIESIRGVHCLNSSLLLGNQPTQQVQARAFKIGQALTPARSLAVMLFPSQSCKRWPAVAHRIRSHSGREKCTCCKICTSRVKTTAPRIPAWSPTVVLTRRHLAWLRRSDGMRYFQGPMAVDTFKYILSNMYAVHRTLQSDSNGPTLITGVLLQRLITFPDNRHVSLVWTLIDGL